MHDHGAGGLAVGAVDGVDGEPAGADVDAVHVLGEGQQGGLVGVGIGVGQGGEAGEFAGLKAGAEPWVEDMHGEPQAREDEDGDGQEAHADAGGQADLAAAAGGVGTTGGHGSLGLS